MTSPTPSEPLTGQELYHGAPVPPATAAKLTAAAIGTIYLVQIVLVSAGVVGLVASSLGDVAVIGGIVWWSRKRKVSLRDLGLRGAPARFLVAALLLGISMWYVTALLVQLVRPPGDVEKLEQVVREMPLLPTLIALTVFPAVAEEIVFRGVLARSLAARLGPLVAIAISAATFALYHLFPPQIVSTFVLGLVLGWLAVKSRSIVPPIIVHLLNNAIAVLLSRDALPYVGGWIEAYPVVTLAIALLLVACGTVLAAKGAAAAARGAA